MGLTEEKQACSTNIEIRTGRALGIIDSVMYDLANDIRKEAEQRYIDGYKRGYEAGAKQAKRRYLKLLEEEV